MSLWFLTLGTGSFVTSLVRSNVTFASDTNYFLFWSAFMLAGAVAFTAVAVLYQPAAHAAAHEA